MIMMSFYGNVVAFDQGLKMCSSISGLILGLLEENCRFHGCKARVTILKLQS